MRIIVDVMSGDNAPLETLKGVYNASLEYNANFINWIESLPYSEIITGEKKKERTEMDEKQFLLDYAANHDLRVINARLRLRALWTAYLLRQNLFFDRKSGMNDLWNAAKLTSWTDDFDEFQAFMNIYFQNMKMCILMSVWTG